MRVLTRTVTAVRRRRRGLLVGALAAVLGAVVGLAVGLWTPAHVEIAGSDTQVWVRPGQRFDQFGVRGVVTLTRATPRALLGEPVGVRATLSLNAGELVTSDGQFNSDILPAYIQAYSDPTELAGDIEHALLVHLVLFTAGGAVLGVLVAAGGYGHRRWRTGYDRRHDPDGSVRRSARAYRAPERRFGRRVVVGLVLLAAVATVPSATRAGPAPLALQGDSIFAGTPLAGAQVDGLLRPALIAARAYIRTYFGETDEYYDALQKDLDRELAANPVALPAGDDVVQVGFVTDRHCNTGMDRVDLALMKHYGVTTLVSAGDDAFSGSFSFESACTRGLAERTRKARISDVFAAGNHDSAQTIDFEDEQKIHTLTGDVVTVDGLHFLGSPDPRTSRYGQGIRPSSPVAQRALTSAQGRAIGRTACTSKGPVIAVLHDPNAGRAALVTGCGKVTLALDGHTHAQAGPTATVLRGGGAGYQFVGASSGGAPTENSVDRSFASQLTVGPLNHDASVNIVSVDRSTGRPVGVTEFHFTPAREITVTQQVIPSP